MEVMIWGYRRLGRMERKGGGEEIGGDIYEGRIEVLGSEEMRGRCFMKRMVLIERR
jgi:hypothetical protein